jgi:hypothetical protein
MYMEGRGVTQDDALAVRWYRAAAEQGDAVGQWSLGSMYENGRGVTQDDALAVRWYYAAANQGHSVAQWALGCMFDDGRAVAQDDVVAYMWFNLSAAQIPQLREKRDRFANRLTPAQRAEGQRRAREWKPTQQRSP